MDHLPCGSINRGCKHLFPVRAKFGGPHELFMPAQNNNLLAGFNIPQPSHRALRSDDSPPIGLNAACLTPPKSLRNTIIC
jgi:hypothetical protein